MVYICVDMRIIMGVCVCYIVLMCVPIAYIQMCLLRDFDFMGNRIKKYPFIRNRFYGSFEEHLLNGIQLVKERIIWEGVERRE